MSCTTETFIDTCEAEIGMCQMSDYGPNGIQVSGSNHITCLATGCTASLATINAAVDSGADALLVHHGIFGAKRHR